MTWNNRIIKHKHPHGDYWAVHEVFYTNGVPDSCTMEPIDIQSDVSIEDLIGSVKQIYRDIVKSKKDVLDYDSFGKGKNKKKK